MSEYKADIYKITERINRILFCLSIDKNIDAVIY